MIRKPHRAWLVLACMILVQGSVIGVMVNCTGVLFAAVLADMGFRAGELSVYYTIRQLTCAATIGLTSRLFFKGRARLTLFLTGACCAVSFLMISRFTQVWQWYIAALFIGLGMSCTTVAVPIVLGNWFNVHRGLAVGITMSASGIAGALYSPILSQLVQRYGWRTAAVITGLTGLTMVALGSLFFQITPEKLGLKPYGGHSVQKTSDISQSQTTTPSFHTVPRWVFALALFALLSANSYTQFNNQLPTFAQSVGYALGTAAVFTSCSMIGNISGKLLTGAMTDRIGVYRAIQVILILAAGSQLLFLLGSGSAIVMQFASLLYGLIYSLGTTIPALLFLDLYGKENYRSKVQFTQSANYFVLSATSLLFPYVYDLTGSFQPIFIAGAAVCVLSLILVEMLRRFSTHRG